MGCFHSIGHNEIIGVCQVGNTAERLGRDHWSEMLSYPRKPIAHWHSLVEVRPDAPLYERVNTWLLKWRSHQICECTFPGMLGIALSPRLSPWSLPAWGFWAKVRDHPSLWLFLFLFFKKRSRFSESVLWHWVDIWRTSARSGWGWCF